MSGPSRRLASEGAEAGGAGGLIARFVRHPNAANLLMALLILLGVYGVLKINTQFFPTLESNRITVSVAWPGATADDAAKNVLDVIEPEVRFLDSIDEVTSYAREGSATITLEFDEGADMQKALSDVEQAVAGIQNLPEESETPIVTKAQMYETVAKVIVRGPFAETALKSFARQLRDTLLAEGLDRVTFQGLRETEYVLDVTPTDLRRLGLTVEDVSQRISANSSDTPSGDLDGALTRQVRTLGDAETPDTLGRIEIVAAETGERVLARDLGVFREDVDELAMRGLSDGRTAIELTVERSVNADTLEMAEVLQRGVEKARAQLPASVELLIYQASADAVAERIGLLLKNGLSGLVLVVLILFVFLNAKIAFWVAAGVPVALLATIGIMYATGQSVNMISLFALIMTLGIIVDDAIVVGEHTATRLAAGDDPEEAAINGAGRMITPVVAAMMTTVAAFAPILLITDTIGQIMGALPLVAIAVLVASFIECFLILPGHLAHALRRAPKIGISFLRMAIVGAVVGGPLAIVSGSEALARGMNLQWLHEFLSPLRADLGAAWAPALIVFGLVVATLVEVWVLRSRRAAARGGGFRRAFDDGFERFKAGVVRPMVAAAVSFRYATIAACAGTMILMFGMLLGGRIPFVFFPSPEAENIVAYVTFNSGISEPDAVAATGEIEAALKAAEAKLTAETGEDLTVASFVILGRAGQNRGENLATIDVELTTSEVRTVRTPAIIAAWREALPDLATVKRVSVAERRLGPPGRDLDVRFKGDDPIALKAASLELQQALETFPGVSGVDDDLPYGKPELGIRLTPRGAALGFTAQSVGRQIRDAVDGRIARLIPAKDEEITVRVRQLIEGTGGALRVLELRAPDGSFVPLTEIADVIDRQGFSVIQRTDGDTQVAVTADVDPSVITNGEILGRLTSDGTIDGIANRHNVDYEFSGRAEEQSTAFADLQLGLLVALGAMYIILAWLFANYARPLAVMAIIPFGLVGALLGHYLMGMPLTILSLIGLLGLSGILVNDSIILVARYDQRLREGEAPHAAVVGASVDRFRAILLTSLSTVGGLAPLLFETSLQAQFLLPMAITIVFGLGVATAYVLFLVPALLAVGADVAWIARFFTGAGSDGRRLAPAR